METKVSTNWRELLERAESGEVEPAREYATANSDQPAWLFRGYLIYTAAPGTAKDLFAKAQRGVDVELAQEAAVYEARCYEYLGQPEEGLILIRSVLARDLVPKVRAHALYVLSVFQSSTTRALKTLEQIDLEPVSPGRKGRIFHRRARLQAANGKLDQALIEYAGAAAYFEEAGDLAGVAHTHNNRAAVYLRMKQFELARAAVDRGLQLLPEGDPFEANFLDEKAQILLAQDQFLEAEQIAIKAVRLVEETDRQGVLCENLCTLGRAYAGQANYGSAVSVFERAAEIAERLDDPALLFQVISARKVSAQKYAREAEVQLAELALKMCDGSYRAAAKKLGMTHTGIIKLLARNSRQWKPKIPKSIISKPVK